MVVELEEGSKAGAVDEILEHALAILGFQLLDEFLHALICLAGGMVMVLL